MPHTNKYGAVGNFQTRPWNFDSGCGQVCTATLAWDDSTQLFELTPLEPTINLSSIDRLALLVQTFVSLKPNEPSELTDAERVTLRSKLATEIKHLLEP